MDIDKIADEYAEKNGIHGESEIECYQGFLAGAEFIRDAIKKEIERRLSFIKDALIGQSPEDLERHYKLIGRKEAFDGLLEFIEKMS